MKITNPAGYNIIEEGVDLWTIQIIDDTTYVGTFSEVIIFAVTRLGFKFSEIESAIQTMIEEEHDSGHFGVNKTFLYSFTRENRKVS